MKHHKLLHLLLASLLASIRPCIGGDGDNLYDVCPGDPANQKIFFNGYPCKAPSEVTASDFKSSVLGSPGDTDNFYRSSTTLATAAEFPGLNTLGLSAARTDMDVDGMVMPHAHPRASEVMFVRAGVVAAGFVDSANRVFQKRLGQGEVFVFPKGLLHFCFNAGFEQATVFSVLNSQNPGLASVSGAMFAEKAMEKLRSVSMEDLNGVSSMELFGE
ncbi:germin-like protein subfamily 3 member 4 [Salvia miltiorrhiza]|uniref:germin-like protein subfamily 3 member 4 n=1 Tax=Salvia miltiorrhiza TaxID=226208 RepID=UPI0025ABB5B9|nr:germin-like protein subfamily 3 member 4 [Salvia miltiorrhiza]XP_057767730.1 germin-like protein subfamily 3 member 4 [Salvia miltiorrhiza]